MLEESYKQVISFGDRIFPDLELKPFILSLPLASENTNTQEGVRKKICRNFSYKGEESNTELGIFRNQDGIFELRLNSLESLDEKLMIDFPQEPKLSEGDCQVIEGIIDFLSRSSTNGLIFIVTKAVQMEDRERSNSFRPILGAVIEIINDKERAIRMVFCKRRFPYSISEKLVRLSIGRILIHAIKWDTDDDDSGNEEKTNGKFISILDSHVQLFPIPAYNILVKEMKMTAHWEHPSEKFPHSDDPETKCPCHNLSGSENSRKFWGISESRYISTIKSNPEIFGSLIQIDDFINDSSLNHTQYSLECNEQITQNPPFQLETKESPSSPSINKKRKVNQTQTDMHCDERENFPACI